MTCRSFPRCTWRWRTAGSRPPTAAKVYAARAAPVHIAGEQCSPLQHAPMSAGRRGRRPLRQNSTEPLPAPFSYCLLPVPDCLQTLSTVHCQLSMSFSGHARLVPTPFHFPLSTVHSLLTPHSSLPTPHSPIAYCLIPYCLNTFHFPLSTVHFLLRTSKACPYTPSSLLTPHSSLLTPLSPDPRSLIPIHYSLFLPKNSFFHRKFLLDITLFPRYNNHWISLRAWA